MMRNSHRMQALGVKALGSMLFATKTTTKPRARADSGSLYEAEDEDDDEEGVVDKVSDNAPRKKKDSMSATGGRVSKRVIAPQEHDQPTRMTRQRTKELTSPEEVPPLEPSAAEEDALVAANSPIQADDQIQTNNEGASDAMIDKGEGERRMGRDLEKIASSICTKLPVQVTEGKTRPELPIQAAKFASEGGIILRDQVPILTHWKEYKKDQSIISRYIGQVNSSFTMDANSKSVKHACTDFLKGGQRQMRYKLKKKYFDGIPAKEVRIKSPLKSMTDEQWWALVDMWSNPRHKEKCAKNKANRGLVQYHQSTGSWSYVAHCYQLRQEKKYKDVPPTAVDYFKECHNIKKAGFTESVQKVVGEMEGIMATPVEEGQVSKSAIEVVSQVLPSNKFLQNVGLESTAPKRSGKTVVAARVQELEAQLETEKQGSAGLKEKLDTMKKHMQEKEAQMEAEKKTQLEEIEKLKRSEETDLFLRRFFGKDKD